MKTKLRTTNCSDRRDRPRSTYQRGRTRWATTCPSATRRFARLWWCDRGGNIGDRQLQRRLDQNGRPLVEVPGANTESKTSDTARHFVCARWRIPARPAVDHL